MSEDCNLWIGEWENLFWLILVIKNLGLVPLIGRLAPAYTAVSVYRQLQYFIITAIEDVISKYQSKLL